MINENDRGVFSIGELVYLLEEAFNAGWQARNIRGSNSNSNQQGEDCQEYLTTLLSEVERLLSEGRSTSEGPFN